jgi:hypothetical protein
MGTPRFPRVGRCAFCTNKADSREHAWLDWVIKRFFTYGQGIRGLVGGVPYANPTQKALRVRCVCQKCNQTWMKALEDAVIPSAGSMMWDLSIPLDPAQQRAISVWAVKTAMVFEFTTSRPHFYTAAEREALRLTHAIPPNTTVFAARLNQSQVLVTYANDAVSRRPGGPVDKAYVTTVAYEHLVIRVVSIRPDQDYGLPIAVDPDDSNWPNAVYMFWPISRNLNWPAPHSIKRRLVHAFHTRFGKK